MLNKMYSAWVAIITILFIFRGVGSQGNETDKIPQKKVAVSEKTATDDNSAICNKERKTNDTLVVIARLTEIAGKFAPNDAYDYVYIMKYRVISVVKGNCPGKEILVGHYNPLIPRKLINDRMDRLVDGTVERFTEGDCHRLTLIRPMELVWDGPVEDDYGDSDEVRYFALKADKFK